MHLKRVRNPVRGRLQTFFFPKNVIVTLSWNPPQTSHLRYRAKLLVRRRSLLLLTYHYPCVCRNTARWTAHTEGWMIVNCTYFLLKHGAKQCRLYIPTFCWQTKRHVARPPQTSQWRYFEKNSLEMPPKGYGVVSYHTLVYYWSAVSSLPALVAPLR